MSNEYRERIWLSDTAFAEFDIRQHKGGVKFSAVLVIDNKRVIGFDNHEGKPPHKHVGKREFPYDYTTPHKLVEDFYEAIEPYLRKLK